MNSSSKRKKYTHESPAHPSQEKAPLSTRTTPNVQKNVTPLRQVQGEKNGKENRDLQAIGGTSATKALHDGDGFKTPTRVVKLSAGAKPQGTPECYTRVEICAQTPGRLSTPSYSDELENDGFSVMVAVRVRPFSRREEADSDVTRVVSMSGNETKVTPGRGATVSSFCYDHCFWSFDRTSGTFSDQQAVYQKVGQPLLYSALEGYHTCLFAYGQTGSGKSYTIMGDSEAKGIIPRFCEELFTRISNPEEENVTYKVEVSFFEIYNEKIHDLLCSTSDKDQKKATLRVREHPTLGPYVEGLSVYSVKTFADISRWIRAGNAQRATASTMMNDASSRSHSVFLIVLTKSKTEHFEDGEHVNSTVSKINLIDLAGSERSSTAQTSGDRLKEGANINKSLLTLGKVISNLSERSLNPKKKAFIPYRESVLTWLLKESLGGNSKTAMIATISPASTHIEETMSTLRYAKQAESIINIPKVNEDPNARIVRELRAEIERLRLLTKGSSSKQQDLDVIKNSKPNLINIDENPQHEETLLYLLKSGKNRIGGAVPSVGEGDGEDKEQRYCIVESANKLFCVKPGTASQTLVNGREVRRQTFLNHGDRLIVGNNYYRFNHPEEVCVKRKRKTTSQSEDVGIKYAKNEIVEEQRKRLEVEVNAKKELEAKVESKTKEIKDMREQLMNIRNMVKETLLPAVKERTRRHSHQKQQPSLLEMMEKEKDVLRERINRKAQKRRKTLSTDIPVTKKFKEEEESSGSLSVQTACIRHLKSSETDTMVQSPNIVDLVLTEMGRTWSLMDRLKDEKEPSTAPHDAVFCKLMSSCDVTVTLLTFFCNMHSSGRDSLANTVRDACGKLRYQLGQFLESLHSRQNDNDIESHYAKFTRNTLFICKLVGELNARIGKSVLVLRKEEHESCDWTLRQAIVTGGDMAVDQELQGGLQEMTDVVKVLEGKMTTRISEGKSSLLESAIYVAKSFAILLNKCQETQFELGSVLAGEERRTSSFYLQSYERGLSLVENIRHGLHEIQEIARLLTEGYDENVNHALLEHIKCLHIPVSTIGLSAATIDLLPSQGSLSSLESTSSTSSDQDYRPSDVAMMASRQVMAALNALERALHRGHSSWADESDDVFITDQRHVRFEEPTSKDILLVTKYSYIQTNTSSD